MQVWICYGHFMDKLLAIVLLAVIIGWLDSCMVIERRGVPFLDAAAFAAAPIAIGGLMWLILRWRYE